MASYNHFSLLEGDDRECDELLGTSMDGSSSSQDSFSSAYSKMVINNGSSSSDDVSYCSANSKMVFNEDNQANNGELGSSSSESMANSSSDKGSSEYVKASDNTSNEDSLRSSANLCLNDEKGMDQDIQNVNHPANKLGTSSSESMANSSSDKGSSENVKASDNTSNEDSSLSLANLCLNDEMSKDQDIQNVNPPANKLGSSHSGSMAILSSEKSSSENVKASDNTSNEDSSRSSANLCLNDEMSKDQSIQEVNPSFIFDAMSQEGSRALVFVLERLHQIFLNESVNSIFKETLNCFFELMTDEYGHQVFTKLIDLLDNLMIEELLGVLHKNQLLISVSLHEYGSISVQKLVEVLQKTPSIRKLTTALAKGNCTLLTHETGKHVVLKCFSILDFDDYEPLYEAIRQQCVDIAWHEVGCISLCACLDFIKNPHRDRLLNGVLLQSTFHRFDCLNSFSIHFLEYVIRLEDPSLTSTFRSNFTGYRYLSMTREGSEFVRTCLRSNAMRGRVVKELVESGIIEDIALDKFGIHVVQLALLLTMETDIELYWVLVKALEPHMETLRYHPTGKVLYSSIQSERFFGKC